MSTASWKKLMESCYDYIICDHSSLMKRFPKFKRNIRDPETIKLWRILETRSTENLSLLKVQTSSCTHEKCYKQLSRATTYEINFVTSLPSWRSAITYLTTYKSNYTYIIWNLESQFAGYETTAGMNAKNVPCVRQTTALRVWITSCRLLPSIVVY
jgi:hypothetical protein